MKGTFEFCDNIYHEKVGKWRFSKNRQLYQEDMGKSDDFVKPAYFWSFYLTLVIFIFILLGRLFILTVVHGEENRELSDSNRIKLVPIEAKRGKIVDREGKILADSAKIYFLKKDSQVKEISEQTAKELAEQGLASENFEGEMGQISQEVRRNYALGEASAHVLGYVSVLQEKDLEANANISAIGVSGRLGVEATYDDFLKGENGEKLIEVDAIGKKVSILGERSSHDGRVLHLTIDSELQKKAYELLKKHAQEAGSGSGAIIAQDPNTGEVLALVSVPSFNPADVGKSMTDEKKPLFDRATQGNYPPGSIFKIVSALAGLTSGKITRDTEIEDVGEFYLGDVRFTNWFYRSYGGKDGILKIDRAIARSNDIFFYKLAEKTGLDSLRQTAIKLGFGQKTGIDLPDESFGLVPDGVWKESTLATVWYPGDTMHLAIGQGFMLATPLQINVMTSYVASAKLTKPYLVSEIEEQDFDGSQQKAESIKIESKTRGEDLVKFGDLDLVREGMRQACETKGTAWPFFNAPYKVGCKTGTAEKELGNPHAWFTVYAPYDGPQISLTVIIEDGGEGSSVAAPVARELLDWWFQRR
ncbi:hypothetical protein A3E14_04205 [Candidatus Curtissbacteria bacterium RIFCSPHIGHO2_12_FULL_41_13]|nr:MAG: hypothetical protein A3E14_04205 [Candidatus Curtissbacteria bacterium RIFCSPHIGHO2_12_FULL_41_13]